MRRYPSLTFDLPPSIPVFGPRAGRLALIRDSSEDDVAGRTVLAAGAHDAATRTGTACGATATTATTTATSATAAAATITIDTPNILVGTVRGVVPHLSRDHANTSDAVWWINIPFESFLEHVPPTPTLQDGPHPLHRFLGFDKDRHIASLCLRDPLDTREMPPNGNAYVSANCVRGVKKVTLSDWRQYVYKTQPDVVFALTDTPFTPPPFSQKRILKSIERSATWVADILRPLPGDGDGDSAGRTEPHTLSLSRHPLNVFVHVAGGTSLPAREAFAHGLVEVLHGAEAEAVKPLRSLDEGTSGYTFDLAVLRGVQPGPNTSRHQTVPNYFLRGERPDTSQRPESVAEVPTPRTETVTPSVFLIPESSAPSPDTVSLLRASLEKLPERKPRLVTGVRSPHEMLHLIRDVGVDLFDAGWAVHAASVGIALDFAFPVSTADEGGEARGTPQRRSPGHNLYDAVFARQFRRLADTLAGAGERVDGIATAAPQDVCPCIACSPHSPSSHILHSALDSQSYATTSGEVGGAREQGTRYEKPYSRAYVHHLLQTHEMSAHTLLVSHNLAVVSAFLAGVRCVWVESGNERFALEAERFAHAYDEGDDLFAAAKNDWERVDRVRGKGRLAREREIHGRNQDR